MMRSKKPYINLIAWQESICLVKNIYTLCEKLPENEKIGITSQLKGAATAVPANIAKGSVKNTPKEFIQFQSISSRLLSKINTFRTLTAELSFIKDSEIKSIFESIERMRASIWINKIPEVNLTTKIASF